MIKSMLKISSLVVLVILFSLKPSESDELISKAPNYGQLPLYFIPNEGQVDENALFYVKASHYTLWLTKDGLIFDRLQRKNKDGRDISRMQFLNANQNPKVLPIDLTGYKVNYFTGKDKSKWRTGIQASKAVLYKDLYTNIDLKIYGMEKQIEYDFVVRRGGEVSDISFAYKETQQTRIDKDGNLKIKTKCVESIKPTKAAKSTELAASTTTSHTNFAEFTHAKPLCYQVIDGQRINIKASFNEIADNTYNFEIGSYNKAYDIIIDPLVLTYSTYLGGSSGDYSNGIAVDLSGAAYITGRTQSTDFPTQTPYQASNAGGYDVFITKINPSGTALIYSTYLGGSENEGGNAITVDSTGAAYISGYTKSSNFPTHNPIYGNYLGGTWGDAFITKLSSSGTALVYSTYLGGSDTDQAHGIAIDTDGAAYITGITQSVNFPTLNAFQAAYSAQEDVFVTKINSAGSALVYSTFLGGMGWDAGMGITVDSQNMACVTGYTTSSNFPTQNPIRGYFYDDVFVTKFDASGSALVFSTFLGDWDSDGGYDIAVDSEDAIYVTGYTTTGDYPWGHPANAFVVKMPPSGSAIDYVYEWGSGPWNAVRGRGIAVDAGGAAYVVATDYPLDPYPGESADTCIVKISPDGETRIYRNYLVGSGEDWGYDIALDSERDVYVTGRTDSGDFSTLDPIQGTNAGGFDVFVSKMPGNPKPDIKANGSDGPITIKYGDTLVVTVALSAGPLMGADADWGLTAKTPQGWYYYDRTDGWHPGEVVLFQRTLIDIPTREVLNMSGLPAGAYTFCFGVDTDMDGEVTRAELYLDKVKVQVN